MVFSVSIFSHTTSYLPLVFNAAFCVRPPHGQVTAADCGVWWLVACCYQTLSLWGSWWCHVKGSYRLYLCTVNLVSISLGSFSLFFFLYAFLCMYCFSLSFMFFLQVYASFSFFLFVFFISSFTLIFNYIFLLRCPLMLCS